MGFNGCSALSDVFSEACSVMKGGGMGVVESPNSVSLVSEDEELDVGLEDGGLW